MCWRWSNFIYIVFLLLYLYGNTENVFYCIFCSKKQIDDIVMSLVDEQSDDSEGSPSPVRQTNNEINAVPKKKPKEVSVNSCFY